MTEAPKRIWVGPHQFGFTEGVYHTRSTALSQQAYVPAALADEDKRKVDRLLLTIKAARAVFAEFDLSIAERECADAIAACEAERERK